MPAIDPDAIVRQLNPAAPELMAVEAGRDALRQQKTHLVGGTGFAIETTLSGHTVLRLMEQARRRNFVVNLIFVGLYDADLNIVRVAARVAAGGHHVPDEDVRRRYKWSMENLARAEALADHAMVFDNSSDTGPLQVLTYGPGIFTLHMQKLPAWVETHLGALLAGALTSASGGGGQDGNG